MGRLGGGPLAALLLVQVSFASLAVVGKIVLLELPPIVVAGIRLFLASLFLAALGLATQRERLERKVVAQLFGLSLLGIVFNQVLFLEGLSRTTAVNASILIATIPVFTTTVAVLTGRESARPARITGIGLALGGALLLLDIEAFDLGRQHTFGNILIVLNALSYSLYLVFSRPLLHRYRSTTVVAWTFLFGSLLVTPLAAIRFASFDVSTVSRLTWWGMAWIVLVPSVLAYSLQNYALKRIQASTVATYAFLQPVIGVSLALLVIEGERLGGRTGLGGALILAGVFLVSRTERYEPVAAIPQSGEAMSRQPIAAPDGRLEPEPQEDDRRGERKTPP